MKATEFDRKFDAGEDVSGHVDWSKGKRPNEQIKRVNVNFPTWVVAGLDRQARLRERHEAASRARGAGGA